MIRLIMVCMLKQGLGSGYDPLGKSVIHRRTNSRPCKNSVAALNSTEIGLKEVGKEQDKLTKQGCKPTLLFR